jgi:hypothetical protein
MRVTLSEAEATLILKLVRAEQAKARREYRSDVFTATRLAIQSPRPANASTAPDAAIRLDKAQRLLDLGFLIEKLEAHRG